MTFVTVSINRQQLTLLSQILVTLFPGCTIHQSRDPMRAIHQLSYQEVDAVFADVDTVSNMMDMLRKPRTGAQIWLLCRQDAAVPEEFAGCYGVLSCPITEQKMRDALQRIPQANNIW